MLPPLNVFPLPKPTQNHKQRLWKTINAPLCEGAFMVLGYAFSGFLGGYSFGLFESGWFCPLSLAAWGWLGCVGVEGGVGVGGASLSSGSVGGFPSKGRRMGLSLLAEGVGWGLISGNHINQCLVNSKPVEAFEMSFTKLSPLQKKC